MKVCPTCGQMAEHRTPYAIVGDMEGNDVALYDGDQYSVAFGNGTIRGRLVGTLDASKSTTSVLWFLGIDGESYLSLPVGLVKDAQPEG